MEDSTRKEVAGAIEGSIRRKNGKGLTCPMCTGNSFVLGEDFVRIDVQQDFKSVSLGGPSIPAAIVVCDNCGFISHHALGVLKVGPMKEG